LVSVWRSWLMLAAMVIVAVLACAGGSGLGVQTSTCGLRDNLKVELQTGMARRINQAAAFRAPSFRTPHSPLRTYSVKVVPLRKFFGGFFCVVQIQALTSLGRNLAGATRKAENWIAFITGHLQRILSTRIDIILTTCDWDIV
jgi:hypothetical protein